MSFDLTRVDRCCAEVIEVSSSCHRWANELASHFRPRHVTDLIWQPASAKMSSLALQLAPQLTRLGSVLTDLTPQRISGQTGLIWRRFIFHVAR